MPLPANLPTYLTRFFGRERESSVAAELLREPHIRLVTLTGPGGTGKTRLALKVVADLLHEFPDGVWFVDLAPIRDPELVPSTIAQALGLQEEQQVSINEVLHRYLRYKHLLLVLDNFEHVVDGAVHAGKLLASASNVKMLVTSRIPLHLSGEHELPVPPLALPDLGHAADITTLTQYAAVALFVERAQAVTHEFQLTSATTRTVAEICVRLDGLPLAIELAAARIKLFRPEALLQRLGGRLKLLTGGPRDLPARQQTLRNTIDWSYTLLKGEEQLLFAQLAVFVGGWTLEAAEAVCWAYDTVELDVLDGLQDLVDKSLVRQMEPPVQAEAEPRFMMLETIREYAHERLLAGSEAENVQRRHAHYYLELAEQAEPWLLSAHRGVWLERLEAEHDNLRAALRWAAESGEIELGLRLAGALVWFWYFRGHWSEGCRWLTAIAELGASSGAGAHDHTRAWRASVNFGRAFLSACQGDTQTAFPLFEESVSAYRVLGDKRRLGYALCWMALFTHLEHRLARTMFEESIALFRAIGDRWGLALALNLLLYDRLTAKGQHSAATRAMLQETEQLWRELGDPWGLGVALHAQSMFASSEADNSAARLRAQESLQQFRKAGNPDGIANALWRLGDVARAEEHYDEAAAYFEQNLARLREQGQRMSIAMGLHTLGWIVLQQGDAPRAVELCEASLALGRELHSVFCITYALRNLALIAQYQGNSAAAAQLYRQSLDAAREINWSPAIGLGLLGVAATTGATDDLDAARRAVRLLAAAVPLLDTDITLQIPAERRYYEQTLAALRARIDEADFAAAWTEGQAMPLEHAIALALGEARPKHAIVSSGASSAGAPAPAGYPAGLSLREVEVLQLLAQGLTYAEIAECLVVSRHTVNAHLRTIYGKLGVTSRTAAARFALEHHLV